MTATRPQTYDAVARALHWLTVLGFIGILSSITVWTIYDGEEWVKSLFGVHKSIGFITLLVIAVRIIWALLNASKRPAADSFAAKAGHLALYVLMLAVPVIGMIRQYGGGRGPLKVFGVEVMQGSPEKIEWMSNLAIWRTANSAGCSSRLSPATSPWLSSTAFKATMFYTA